MSQSLLTHSWARVGSKNCLLVLAFALAFLAGCSEKQEAAAPVAPSVVVTPVRQDTVPIWAEYVGQTDATTVEVRTRVEGIIRQIVFTEGTQVAKGDLLVLIEPEPYKIALENAQAKLARDEATLHKARSDVARLRPLVKQRAVSRQKLEDAVAKLKESNATWKASQTAVKEAKLNLAYTTVRSPISGMIGRRKVSEGSLVGKGEPTLLAVVSRLNPLYVDFAMSEQDAFKMEALHDKRALGRAESDTVTIPIHMVLPDGTVFSHEGEIDFVDRQMTSETGTLAFRAKFPNPRNRLRPGMYAKIRMLLTEKAGALLVPQRAIQEEQGGQYILVVQEDKTVQRRRISAGSRHRDERIIDDGVSLGELVIVEGQQKVRPAMAVNPVMADDEQQRAMPASPLPTASNP